MEKLNIGVVTTWFERGAAYVSKQYLELLKDEFNVFIYARGGEEYSKKDKNWALDNVTWDNRSYIKINTYLNIKQFRIWLIKHNIKVVLFNEQHWWLPLIECHKLNIKTVAYVDYYTEQTIPLFKNYDLLICNTRKHFDAFKWHQNSHYIPWGTDIVKFKSNIRQLVNTPVTFFHSCGFNPIRKGTDILLLAVKKIIAQNFKLIIHSQVNLEKILPNYFELIKELKEMEKLEIIEKTVGHPGLYHLGDIYVYPTRLEGIGLTIMEALASGLPVITTNFGPMNEFIIDDKNGKLINVKNIYSRYDGYYWPQAEASVDHLATLLLNYIKNPDLITTQKEYAINYSISELDWSNNKEKVIGLFNQLKLSSKNVYFSSDEISKFERSRPFAKYYWFFKSIWTIDHFFNAIKS